MQNLVFVQHYNGFACFLRSKGVPKRSKIDKTTPIWKTSLKKTSIFSKINQKVTQNGLVFRPERVVFFLLFRLWRPKVPKEGPKGAQGSQKCPKRCPNGAPRYQKSHKSDAKCTPNSENNYTTRHLRKLEKNPEA